MGFLEVKDTRFEVAVTPEQREAVYRFRYAVWVEEMKHASPSHFPNGMIQDRYDANAIQAVAVHQDGVAAALRLVPPSGIDLPIQSVVHHPMHEKRAGTGELSHLVVGRHYRRRKEDGPYGAEPYLRRSEGGLLPDTGPLSVPLLSRGGPRILLALLRLLYQASKSLRITRWVCLVDGKVITALNRYAMPFRQFADRVPEYPDRVPAAMEFSEFEDRLRRLEPALFEEFIAGLDWRFKP